MAGSLVRKPDGSIALFIRGDLQFDSNDERIYHESLALPAVAIAAKRLQSPLRVLVIGGGDGLVAREICKSARVSSLDLVDYDPEILSFAQSEFLAINERSLLDPRSLVHVKDAWEFVEDALRRSTTYDVIISDLTVADDIAGARFHSIEWYERISRLLASKGVLAVNAVSAEATPEAYWSIFNSMQKGGLQARPYHIHLPSFTAQGFGQDWGFFLASVETITTDDLDESLRLAEPRYFLGDTNHLLQLFEFPTEMFEYQARSLPALEGSDILLRYFSAGNKLLATSGVMRNALTLNTSSIFVPEPDSGKEILSREIGSVLANAIYSDNGSEFDQSGDAQMFLHRVVDLMPSLQREHTQEVIEEFLENPEVFLQAIDVPGLVARLLKRASELPSQLVKELELLRDKLQEWAGDHLSLLNLGRRVITILMLVIVIGNLLYPDTAYGKGETGAHLGAGHHAAARRGGYGNGGYWNNGGWSGGTTEYINQKRVINNQIPVKKGGSPNLQIKNYQKPSNKNAMPGKQSGMLRPSNKLDRAEYFDESGAAYPARLYRFDYSCIQADDSLTADALPKSSTDMGLGAVDSYAVYRLGPGADILPTGHVAMFLTEQSYLLVTSQAMHLIDQRDGSSIMSFSNDETLLGMLAAEVDRQHGQLEQAEPMANYLTAAKEIIASINIDAGTASKVRPDGTTEVFPSAWITASGKYLAFRAANGQVVCLDGRRWYSDEAGTELSEPYPVKASAEVLSYLATVIRDVESTQNRLLKDRNELNTLSTVLTNELATYESSDNNEVKFGSRSLPRVEAIRLTELAVKRAKHQITSLDLCIEQLPAQIDIAKMLVSNFANVDT